MKKGVVPTGVFRQMFESHARQRRQARLPAQAAVAAPSHAPGSLVVTKPKLMGADGTKDRICKKAAIEARLGRMVEGTKFPALHRSKRLAKCTH